MFITVKFGESEEGIFNPQCKCVTLLSNIRDRCCHDEVEVEVSDESGNVKNLRDWPNRYADEILVDRETLVLLRVERNDTGDCRFTPLLNDQTYLTDTFLAQLASGSDQLDNSGGRRSRSSIRRSKLQKAESKDSAASKTTKPGGSTSQSRTKSRMK